MLVLELSCGCQIEATDKVRHVRRCKPLKVETGAKLRAYLIDHYHAIEARRDEVRRHVQGQ